MADIVGLLMIIGWELVKALRYAAQNAALRKKVYLDEATGLPNKNKCKCTRAGVGECASGGLCL